ncbi:hypothetical protein [uncultured Bradyrhizobium sp.]|uniref:hypothetical protein n=1 Tax=uncultured Bradyrhizobium sp. TaxID=199684 RepID=UPI0035C95EA5
MTVHVYEPAATQQKIDQSAQQSRDDRETRYGYRLAAIGLTVAITTMTACYVAERGKTHYQGPSSDASNVRLIPF